MHRLGIPSYSVFGWQRPCYLMSDGYAKTYKELIETTDWAKYGRGRDPRCDNCMAHCGYEPTAVLATTKSLRESIRAAVGTHSELVSAHRFHLVRLSWHGEAPGSCPGALRRS